ncbi:hypothetical protein LCGC14_0997370 [marine sediment metagenome]|uniref:Uncharacterized protein n=1 Tax=marine sediment metagenome TaxID=412755 RepID=A0A0F9N431_9ZZZZ|nr:hypothetical protein [Methylophaga sp.]
MNKVIYMENIDGALIEIARTINNKIDPNFVDDPAGDQLIDDIQQLLEKHFNYPLHRNYN